MSVVKAETKRVCLTEEQVEQYWRDGFIVVPNLLEADHIEQMKAKAREFALGKVPPGTEKWVVKDVRVAKGEYKPDDPEKGLWKFLWPDRMDPLFKAYAETPRLLNVVQDLIGPDIKAFLTMFIYKPPGIDAVHYYHQDGYYFSFGPHDKVLGTWVPLDPTDADNGTLSVIPGSHKLGLLPHVTPKDEKLNAGIFGVEGFDDDPSEVVLELNPGDGVFFHARTLHKTGGNKTQRHRRVITVHMASSACVFDKDSDKRYDFRLVRGKSYEGCI